MEPMVAGILLEINRARIREDDLRGSLLVAFFGVG